MSIENGKAIGIHYHVLDILKGYAHRLGYCTVENNVIAKELGRSATRISHIISDLVKAGLINRRVQYHQGSRRVEKRYISIATTKAATPIANDSKEQTDKVYNNKDAADPVDNLAKNEKREIVKMGDAMGVGYGFTLGMIRDYGVSRVKEVLHMVEASGSVRNPYAWIVSALKKNYKPSKKAAKALSDAPYKVTYAPFVIANAPEIKKKESVLECGSFLREALKGCDKSGYSARRFAHLF